MRRAAPRLWPPALLAAAALSPAFAAPAGGCAEGQCPAEGGGGAAEGADAARRADALAAAGRLQEAIAAYSTALANPRLPAPEIVWFNFAQTLADAGQHATAVQAFNKTLRIAKRAGGGAGLEPQREAQIRVAYADALSRVGAWGDAAAEYSAALGLGAPDEEGALSHNAGAALLNARTPESLAAAVPLLRHAVAAAAESGAPRRKATLAVALTLTGDLSGAAPLLEELLGEPEAGLHQFIAFNVEEVSARIAIRHLSAATEAEGFFSFTDARAVVYRLARLLRLDGRQGDEHHLIQRAVAAGLWPNAGQRPGYVFSRPLPSAPYPGEDAGLRAAKEWAGVWEAVRLLEQEAAAIAAEFLSAVPVGGAADRSPLRDSASNVSVVMDNENIADAGSWRQCIFARNGRPLPHNWDSPKFAVTARVLRQIREQAARDLPKGSMEFSVLSPHSHLKAHCGPTNHRIRLHLPVLLPPEGAPSMRVGEVKREWHMGKVLVLDDSFDHEVWNPTSYPRAVLLIDVWHPLLTEEEREKVRRDFAWHDTSWWTFHSPYGQIGGGL
eukprot:TRINITY_DN14322_c0_g1_i1.p1 TRINITY_DN14322_c0_g1~~TRINITY_DN14322_c0_g1_i1.p1  ORF type:complete len:578 (+),score=178.15 TRINITY_DN14322_c0_g1_i1:69-1736(+)